MTTKAELCAIRCDINQAIHLPNINKIFVITDSIHAARRIFDSLSYLYQAQLAVISRKLREFFKKDNNNFIDFWDCPSNHKQLLYNIVDKETKKFNLSSVFLHKLLWDFSKKCEYDFIINNWKISFQASDNKGHNFLELFNKDSKPIKLYISKDSSWLKFFGHSNLLCARTIINHTPISEYWLRFFSQEKFKCLCSLYSIELRHYILYKCKCFNQPDICYDR